MLINITEKPALMKCGVVIQGKNKLYHYQIWYNFYMRYFFVNLFINSVALWAAARVINGISYIGPWYGLLLVALVFGGLNAFVKPVLKCLSLPIVIFTLGLFIFVLNAFMLWLTGVASRSLDLGFSVSGFRPALFGALFISVVNMVLSCLINQE
jgi:putative membrane protein